MKCQNHQHDYDNAIKKGRAYYICPKCNEDISIEMVFIFECFYEYEK